MRGGEGDDVLFGEAGNDILYGDAGADILNGGEGIDAVSYIHSRSGVFISLGRGSLILGAAGTRPPISHDQGFSWGGDATGDTLYGIETLIGSGFGDVLAGNSADNILVCGKGDDCLHGGLGRDVFRYRSRDGHDVITDFHAAGPDGASGDVIRLEVAGVHGLADVMRRAVDSEEGVVIRFTSKDSITLLGVDKGSLSELNFYVI